MYVLYDNEKKKQGKINEKNSNRQLSGVPTNSSKINRLKSENEQLKAQSQKHLNKINSLKKNNTHP